MKEVYSKGSGWSCEDAQRDVLVGKIMKSLLNSSNMFRLRGYVLEGFPSSVEEAKAMFMEEVTEKVVTEAGRCGIMSRKVRCSSVICRKKESPDSFRKFVRRGQTIRKTLYRCRSGEDRNIFFAPSRRRGGGG